ncbi:glycosyltransferase family 39 protein, partial [bacterium]|nr:glycosyltransferase family 39 protein [bacterium]
SAIWIYINEHIFLVGREPALESLQTVTLFYSLCIIVSAYKIFRYFGLSKWSLYVPLIFVNFHPAIIRLATTINNDALMVVFVLISIIWAFRWYRDNTTKSLVMMALFSSLGMMTKLSAIMVLPLIVCLLLAVLWRERSKRVCTQIILFFAIFLPMSFWFEVRNYINWQVPIMYVQRMKESDTSFIGNRSFLSRVSDFSPWQFRSVYLQNDNRLENCDVNPLTISLKTSMFGEFIRDFTFSKKAVLPKIGAEYASVMLFWTNVLFSIISFFCAFFAFDGKYTCEKLSLLIFAGVMFVAIYWQIYDQPFVCSADFRYIAPMAVISPLFVGVYLDNLQAHDHKHFFINAMIFLILLFSLCSTAVYWIVC